MEVFVMELQVNVNVQLDLLETSVKKVSICKSVLKATENWPILLKKNWALFFFHRIYKSLNDNVNEISQIIL